MAFGHWMEVDETVDGVRTRVRLGPIARDDAKRFVSAEARFGMQSYEVGRYLGARSAETEEQELEWFDEQSKDKEKLSWGVYVPDGDDGWRLIGSTVLMFHKHSRGARAETGFMLFDREHWGRHVAATAHLARTLYAFDELDMVALTSSVFVPNLGSNRALQGIGYVQSGTGYAALMVHGKAVDVNQYLLPNPEDDAWRWFWRRPDADIPQAFHDGRIVAQRTMERARSSVTFL